MVRCRAKWALSFLLFAWIITVGYIAYLSYNNSLLNSFASIPAPGSYSDAVLREVTHFNEVVISSSLPDLIFQLKIEDC